MVGVKFIVSDSIKVLVKGEDSISWDDKKGEFSIKECPLYLNYEVGNVHLYVEVYKRFLKESDDYLFDDRPNRVVQSFI